MNLKDELLDLFPTIEIDRYNYSVNPFVRNNRKYNVLIFYRIRIKCGKETRLLWIYVTKTKYIISWGYSLQSTILNKKEKYKLFQIVAAYERLTTNQKFNTDI